MFFEPVIKLKDLSKSYQIYDKPRDRLLQMLVRGKKKYYKEFWALKDVNLEVRAGEVVGVIGSNGAGKSTLLQLVCGTLAPTTGVVSVIGRVAALLELGAGFNPEFTGRENVYLSASILGLTQDEIDRCYDDIVAFSGIGAFIDQPVKTYSSGMYVRLAFSVATSVDPNILVIDEALSVGDGEFSQKSFKRIMAMKEQGKTILFCSHSLYQVEAFCDRAIWLNTGEIKALGPVKDVVAAYAGFMDRQNKLSSVSNPVQQPLPEVPLSASRIESVNVWIEGAPPADKLIAINCKDTLCIRVRFATDLKLPVPVLGITLTDTAIQTITSAGSHIDSFKLCRDENGGGEVVLTFPRLPLLKGEYLVHVFLLCDRGIHIYDQALTAARIQVKQDHLEQGVVSIPHKWSFCEE